MRVVVADDHQLVIAGLRQALAGERDIEIVGEAADGAMVLPLVRRLQPDLVLLDVSMPRMDGLVCLSRIKAEFPAMTVVMLSLFSDEGRIREALTRGASGYIVKTVRPDDLASALRIAGSGTVYLPLAAPEEPSAADTAGLSEREKAILAAVAQGRSTAQIASEFWVSSPTVKFHLRNIFRKLGVSNRTEAARWAYANGVASLAADLETLTPGGTAPGARL